MTPADRPAGARAGAGDAPNVPDGWAAALTFSTAAVAVLVDAAWRAAHAAGSATLYWESAGAGDDPAARVRLAATIACPAVRLDPANGMVAVTFAVAGGRLSTGIATANAGVAWSDPVAVDTGDGLYLSAAVRLRVDATDVGGTAVRLPLADGGFTLASDTGFPLPPCRAAAVGFAARDDGVDGSALTLLSFAAQPMTDALRAANVSAAPVATPDGSAVLRVLTGPAAATVPAEGTATHHPAGHDVGLAIASQVTMTLIANAYNQGAGDIKLVPMPSADGADDAPWCVQVHQPMVFDGRFGNQTGTTYVHDHATMFMRFVGSTGEGLTLATDIDPSSTIRLHLDLSARFPVSIAQHGDMQAIRLDAGEQAVAGAGFYESIVRPQLAAFLHGDIRRDMAQVRIVEVDRLARRSLRLPGHGLRFDAADLPGELRIGAALLPI